jgi:PAS domain S-box-containing protein
MVATFLFGGTDELHARLAGHDWSSSVLGPPASWPAAIRTVVRLMLDSKHPMFVFWGPDLGLIYNQPYVEFLQDKHPRALGRPFRETWAELWPQLSPLVERALAGESIYIEDMPLVMFRNGRNEQAWFTFSYSPIYDDQGTIVGLHGTGVDTTRRITTERRLAFQVRMADQLRGLADPLEVARRASRLLGEELGASRVLFGEITDDGEHGVFHSNHTDGSVPELHGAFDTASFGATLFATLRSGRTSVHNDIDAELGTVDPQAARSFRAVETGAEISVPVLREGRLTSLLIVNHRTVRVWTPYEIELVQDMAERIWNAIERARAEASLRQANHKLEELLSQRTAERDRLWDMAQEILAIATTDGYFLSCNPAMTGALGWTERELQVTPFAHFAHPDQLEELQAVVAELAAGNTVSRYEIRSRHRDGSYRWLSWTIVPKGKLLYMAGRDVSEEKQREESLRQAEEALRQAQKMEAIGQLTGGIAHDFNNMLGIIVGNIELARFHLEANRAENLGRYLDGAQHSADRAATLTHRLLAFARQQTLVSEPTDINGLVRSMSDMIARTMGPAITVELQLESTWRVSCCDPNQLENALLNLAINARDAMPEGGRLLMRTSDLAGAPQYIRISVSDTGTGMDEDTAARAFDPFFTTKPLGQGTGLGLSMVFGFVKQSNGHVGLETAPGHGTTVHIDLERHAGDLSSPEADTPAVDAAVRPKGVTILLVDDEADLREVLAEVLRGAGHTVFEAGDGPTALAKLRHIDRIDLLVTDIGLPGGMNGRQLAQAVRGNDSATRVLLITGYADLSVFGKGSPGPDMQLLTKPFALKDFSARIADIVAALPVNASASAGGNEPGQTPHEAAQLNAS